MDESYKNRCTCILILPIWRESVWTRSIFWFQHFCRFYRSCSIHLSRFSDGVWEFGTFQCRILYILVLSWLLCRINVSKTLILSLLLSFLVYEDFLLKRITTLVTQRYYYWKKLFHWIYPTNTYLYIRVHIRSSDSISNF